MLCNEEVPCLTTATSEPLRELERLLLQKQCVIESWLRNQWQLTPPTFYNSVDLRNAGFKLAPVDTNLFPAGFNNLNPDFLPLCIQAVQSLIGRAYPTCQRILLVPESHTRNQFYFESVAMLYAILSKAGYDVRIGSLLDDFKQAKVIELPSGKQITLETVQRRDDRLVLNDFSPCLIVLNNDLSAGIPDILQGLQQAITPSVTLGWSTRLKSTHFHHYEQISSEFAKLIDLDPWLINPLFRSCSDIDFMTGEGEGKIVEAVGSLLVEVQKKYDEYGIKEKPYAVVKADTGTYGMGVMMVHDASELTQMNRKQRTQMAKTKGNQKITRVIIQEGIYTFETWGEQKSVAEPVVYMLGQHVVGGFYRVHTQRDRSDNLNAPGMHFEHLAFARSCNNPDRMHAGECEENRFYAYGVIARLAGLAAARELAQVEKK